MSLTKINLAEVATTITEHWRPTTLGAVSGHEVKLAKLKGEFVWHQHEDADEMFLCVAGSVRIELKDGAVTLNPGEMLIVPAGTQHRPVAEEEATVLLFERAGLRNTGDVEDARLTAPEKAT